MAINPNTDFTPGAIFTAGQADRFPRGIMAFRNRTANTGVIAAGVDTVTITAISFTAEAGRYYRITYYEPQLTFGAGHTYTDMAIRNGTTAAGTLLALGAPNGTTTVRNSDSVIAVATFSAGTVNVVATMTPNGGTVNGTAGATFPAFLIVEDIGPS
jgi:hypothetical protein